MKNGRVAARCCVIHLVSLRFGACSHGQKNTVFHISPSRLSIPSPSKFSLDSVIQPLRPRHTWRAALQELLPRVPEQKVTEPRSQGVLDVFSIHGDVLEGGGVNVSKHTSLIPTHLVDTENSKVDSRRLTLVKEFQKKVVQIA